MKKFSGAQTTAQARAKARAAQKLMETAQAGATAWVLKVLAAEAAAAAKEEGTQ